ncbi:ATP-binding protein [Sorangium sp. So ce136]|uniref:ATP-binding protein n=1 Tax=Sorangium sp. So ce136 TaxID=3133284 RepID=UPI003F03EFEF
MTEGTPADLRRARLFFEVFTRRYDAQKPLLLSTNKAFVDWDQVFPHAACVVMLVDRLVHRAEVIEIEAESYRLKGVKELNATPHQAAPHQEALSGLFTGELHRHPAWSSPAPAAGFIGELHRIPADCRDHLHDHGVERMIDDLMMFNGALKVSLVEFGYEDD